MWIHNAGIAYCILLGIFSTVAFFVMRTMPAHGTGSLIGNLVNYSRMELLGFLGGFMGVGLFILSMAYVRCARSLNGGWGRLPNFRSTFTKYIAVNRITIWPVTNAHFECFDPHTYC